MGLKPWLSSSLCLVLQLNTRNANVNFRNTPYFQAGGYNQQLKLNVVFGQR